jgi:hypothetical protein
VEAGVDESEVFMDGGQVGVNLWGAESVWGGWLRLNSNGFWEVGEVGAELAHLALSFGVLSRFPVWKEVVGTGFPVPKLHAAETVPGGGSHICLAIF